MMIVNLICFKVLHECIDMRFSNRQLYMRTFVGFFDFDRVGICRIDELLFDRRLVLQ